jgi:hypothetical protein
MGVSQRNSVRAKTREILFGSGRRSVGSFGPLFGGSHENVGRGGLDRCSPWPRVRALKWSRRGRLRARCRSVPRSVARRCARIRRASATGSRGRLPRSARRGKARSTMLRTSDRRPRAFGRGPRHGSAPGRTPGTGVRVRDGAVGVAMAYALAYLRALPGRGDGAVAVAGLPVTCAVGLPVTDLPLSLRRTAAWFDSRRKRESPAHTPG